MTNINLILTVICITEFSFIILLLYTVFKLYKSKKLNNINNRQINEQIPDILFRYLESSTNTITTDYKSESSISYNDV